MGFLHICTAYLLVSWLFNSLLLCATDNRLVPGKPLSPGNTLISDDGTFTLGFFSPSNSSTKHYYVGIWYSIPQRNIVWVANRATPITDPSLATLALTNSSNLVMFDANGDVLWTTNVRSSNNSPAATSAEAMLENTGNFILRSPEGAILWKSFDHPTDTLLPGMNLRISHKTHALQRLVAWKDLQDPSPGNFSYSADPNSLLQRFLWNGSRPYYRSPVWTGYLVVGPYIDSLRSTIYMTLQQIGDEIYLSLGIPSGPSSVLLKMKYSGNVEIQIWDYNMSEWTVLEAKPNHECNTYGYCGPSGYCDNTEPVITCKCLDGFEPSNNRDWTNGEFSQGCRRKEVLRCGRGDDFLTLPGMKIPDKFLYVRNRSFDECTAECSSNCSCMGYAYSNMSTRVITGDDTRCLVWMGELIDTGKIIDGENLYIRINGLIGNQRNSNIVKIVPPAVATLLIIICIGLVWTCNCRGKQQSKEIWKRLMLGDLRNFDELGDGKLKFPFISFRAIAIATKNFSNSNMLGQGGFGNVYKGTLKDSTEIAVKRLNKSSGQGIVEFRTEVILIAKLQHRNLVKLLGCCVHGDEKLLVYEYLPNKSLDAFLFNAARKSLLDWPTRFKVIKGVARGLLYLHQDSRLTIIHRDLKASNILLDAEMNPKISDFGLARIFGGNQQQANTNRVVGTYGYMSPEYALEGAFSVKSDVYSFGVLLLEIVSGLKINTTHLIMDFSNLISYAWSLWKGGNSKDLIDSSILENFSLDEVLQCIHVGLLCVQDSPNVRPLMSSVVFILENGATTLPPPKQPIFFAHRNLDTYVAGEIANTANNLSLTTLEGR